MALSGLPNTLMNVRRTTSLSQGRNRLCSLCSKFLYNWYTFSDVSLLSTGILGAVLPVPLGFTSCCPLCQLLIRAADRVAAARWVTRRPEYIRLKESSTALKLEGSEYSVFKGDKLDRVEPTSIPWTKVGNWLAECDKHDHSKHFSHSKRCRLMRLKVRLIDVNEMRLVIIPSKGEFAALSYKWGGVGDVRQPRLTQHNLDLLQQPGALNQPHTCARTIRDAMEICRQVGVQYLWVDALCIIQDSKQKSLHMLNMDAIYASASFTIVPADSQNAFHGIHGVSQPRGRVQNQDVDPSWFVFGINSISNWLAKSPWAGRSWTYQEATLSRRLLVFTEELCCLICPNGMYREDGYTEPPSDPDEPLILLQYQPTFPPNQRPVAGYISSVGVSF